MRKSRKLENSETSDILGQSEDLKTDDFSDDVEVITGDRRYTVLNSWLHKGKPTIPRESVELNDRQADMLKESGYIE